MSKKIITFVNNVEHSNVEELSTTYQSPLLFSNQKDGFLDIYHDSHLYSYIQGIDKSKYSVKYDSGYLKIESDENLDELTCSYAFFSDKTINLYPICRTSGDNGKWDIKTRQIKSYSNEYTFTMYHSNDISINSSNFTVPEGFEVRYDNIPDTYTLKANNSAFNYNTIKDKVYSYILKYNINNNTSISSTINTIYKKPTLKILTSYIKVANGDTFTIPYELKDNENHCSIKYIPSNESYIKQVISGSG